MLCDSFSFSIFFFRDWNCCLFFCEVWKRKTPPDLRISCAVTALFNSNFSSSHLSFKSNISRINIFKKDLGTTGNLIQPTRINPRARIMSSGEVFKDVPIPRRPPCSSAGLLPASRKAEEANVCKLLSLLHLWALSSVWSHLSGLISLNRQWQCVCKYTGAAAVTAEMLHMLISTLVVAASC